MKTSSHSTDLDARLAEWEQRLRAEVEVGQQRVTLPVSGQEYLIHLPTDAARDDLFARAKADPSIIPPHWSRVWTSGVALADYVIAHADEIAGKPVIELGSGLGVTATAALDRGADLITVDVAALPLAFCQYNALYNAGREHRQVECNWRELNFEHVAGSAPPEGFPIILAADVLYDSKDIDPLIALIDRLLAPDGELWLAEPGRKTAERFLYTVAMAGWEGTSYHYQVDGLGPDSGNSQVHVRILRRPSSLDPFRGILGGWRL